jgi:hypothetical protein
LVTFRLAVDGFTLTARGTGGGFTVSEADPDALVVTTLVAVTVTVAGLGTAAGAVYSPLALMVPIVLFPPGTPFTDQVTPVFEVPVTVAMNC